MTSNHNRGERRLARDAARVFDIAYVHALRLIREGKITRNAEGEPRRTC